MKFIRAIQLPDRVSQTVFDLPCVFGVTKNTNKEKDGEVEWCLQQIFICNRVSAYSNICFAYAGEWLCEDENGNWYVFTDEEYKKQQL